ncbi:transposase [Salinibacter ruber]|uniref:Mutator family transposase n=1 Tax=Salinibacter ruber (strain DSM 13855 / M31) TaxID=309807 RepID=Q2S4X8_SALRD|nr:IS256 family transposase, truncated [Salinibacter ruber DSM 13855]
MLDKTSTDYQDWMHKLLDRVLKTGSQTEAQAHLKETSEELELKAPSVFKALEEVLLDVTAVLALPEKYRKRPRTTNVVERLTQESRRREKVIRILSIKASAWRNVGALLAEKHEEWSTGRRCWTMEKFNEGRIKESERGTEELQSESPNPTLERA